MSYEFKKLSFHTVYLLCPINQRDNTPDNTTRSIQSFFWTAYRTVLTGTADQAALRVIRINR